MREIIYLIKNGHEVSYKLLSIGLFKFDGVQYVQVHCDRKDIEFSNMYDMSFINRAVAKYTELHSKYKVSERKYGNFVPLNVETTNVSK